MAKAVDARSSNKKRIIVTLTGGGFLWEAKALVKGLGSEYEYHYVTASVPLRKEKISDIPEGEMHIVSKITTISEPSLWRIAGNTLVSLKDAFKLVKEVKPDAVICLGTSLAFPLCFWAKVFRRKAVFVESITRISDASRTGKILSRLRLCDRFYVQWPDAVKLYRGAIYRGAVL